MSADLHVDVVGNGGSAIDSQYGSSGFLDIDDISRDRDFYVSERLQIPANLAIGPYQYPGANGFSTIGFPGVVSFGCNITAGLATTVVLTIEGTNNLASPVTWYPCTELFVINNGVGLNPSITVSPSTNSIFSLSLNDPQYTYYRLVITVSGGASNSVVVDLLRRA